MNLNFIWRDGSGSVYSLLDQFGLVSGQYQFPSRVSTLLLRLLCLKGTLSFKSYNVKMLSVIVY